MANVATLVTYPTARDRSGRLAGTSIATSAPMAGRNTSDVSNG